LGGHSFAAVQVFSEIERLTGKNLPLATLFRASTVGQLADVLRKDGWSPPWSSLVPIDPGGSQLPLFLVHGAEGNVCCTGNWPGTSGRINPFMASNRKG